VPPQFAVGAHGDVLHNGVAVPFAIGNCDEDVTHRQLIEAERDQRFDISTPS
jgi:hypothetical protein